MKIGTAHAIEKIIKKTFLAALTALIVFATTMPVDTAHADIAQDVRRLFELHAKLTPGMTIEALSEILGQPAESHALRGNSSVTRYVWLHGTKGIEIYEVEGLAHRVVITLPCGNSQNQSRAMDALTRQGYSKYGSMPRAYSRRNEFYWVRNGIRFAFSRHNQNTVLSTITRAH